ncbi:MAG: HDOD domain-containing protein [Rhodocyclaceae bacterium]|nr:HDOD domain-containing protein [Rhodocyclaceae bacterium]MDZ4216276.1 HDOD domain-containing protein [Rhodocyclaceae bacterium]
MNPQAIDYKNIPVQADIISGIIRLDPEANNCFRDLDSFVRSDQGVATLVLRVVNSPLYSRGRQIATIPIAISVLGFNVVRSLAMLAFSRSLFSKSRDPAFRLHIWQHSLLTAIAGRNICHALGGGKEKDEAFIAGLMHDMGAVLMFTHDHDRYRQVMDLMQTQGVDTSAAEQQVFGFNRFDVGREAVSQWKLPARFADFMGADTAAAAGNLVADRVWRSLAAANCLIEGVGIGSVPIDDVAMRKAALLRYEIDETLCDEWLQPGYVDSLKEDDTYQLCANL